MNLCENVVLLDVEDFNDLDEYGNLKKKFVKLVLIFSFEMFCD